MSITRSTNHHGSHAGVTGQVAGRLMVTPGDDLSGRGSPTESDVIPANQNRCSILVVDDIPAHGRTLRSMLADLDVDVVLACSGQEALTEVQSRLFAVILLDVRMPAMDGYETAILLHAQPQAAHTPIIFISGFADELHKLKGYTHGAVDYILTPVNPDVLRTKVRVFVDLFQMMQAAKQYAEQRVAQMRKQVGFAVEEATIRRRRSSFLAHTSAILAPSLTEGNTARDLARLSVPFLSDLSLVSLVSHRMLDGVEVAWSIFANDTVFAATQKAAALPPRLLDAMHRALDTGKSELIENLGVRFAGLGLPLNDAAQSAADYDLGSTLLVPLRARNNTLGIMVLLMTHSERRFGQSDCVLAEDLADRAAVFLDNAQMYRAIQTADARKNEFLAMLAHELRNPLAAIEGAVRCLDLPNIPAEKGPWARGVIRRQLRHLVRMVDDLLDLARITQGKVHLEMEPVDLLVVVEMAVEITSTFIKSRRHSLNVSVPQKSVWVEGDASRLAQVLANLLSNAAKYTADGGKIWLSLEAEDGQALLRVRDNGVGIPLAMQASIFDLFTQVDRSLDRAQGGLGIGLTLARQLAEMHGGSVSVHSAGPDQGSEFTVHLPLSPNPPGEPPEFPNPDAQDQPRRRVMIVDDNRDVSSILATMLEASGHEVFTVADGQAALESVHHFNPEVVVLDIGLPGMDGYEVARRMRKLPALSHVLLVALTGYGETEVYHRAKAAGFDAHLVKPVELETLNALIGRSFPKRDN